MQQELYVYSKMRYIGPKFLFLFFFVVAILIYRKIQNKSRIQANPFLYPFLIYLYYLRLYKKQKDERLRSL